MIERIFTAQRINEIVNDPSVYPWVCGPITGPLDLSPIVDDKRNIALFGEHGGVIFMFLQMGLYEAHTQVLPAGRGRWTVEMVNAALNWMFTHTEAVEIMTRVPHGNIGAKALVRAIKGEFEFTNPNGWVFGGESVPADIYALRIQQWIKTAPGLPERGHWFHEKLEREYAALGKQEEPHPDDDNHDRYVGAAVEMFFGNQPHKAVVFYNRWAALAGYAEVQIVTERPLTVDIQDALLSIRENDFWVMTCR